MKHVLPLLLLLCACQQNPDKYWPDSSKIGRWFSQEAPELRGAQATTFLITDYGAIPDSLNLQTEAIQKAIDAAAEKGGTVVVPAGTYLTGALFFKEGTHLHLDDGAVLKGSACIEDYPDVPVHIEGVLQPYPAAIINASGRQGFRITGKGTLDGNGAGFWDAFWARRRENPACTNLEVRRPRMIYISNSQDLLIDGIRLRNSGFWNIHLYKCSRVRVKDIDVFAPVKPVWPPSTDGIDLDACSDVHIIGSSFSTGDDLIALKGGKGPWADEDPDNGINERVLVEDCRFGTGPGVLVFGSECVGAHNIILRNSEAHGTGRLLWLKMRPDTPQEYSHIRVENVRGEVKYVLYVKPWTQFFDLKGREDIPMSAAEDVTIQNCTLQCHKCREVKEAPDQYTLSGITLKDNLIESETE